MNVFQLRRMRWLDLLALWHQENPDSRYEPGADAQWLANLPPTYLAALILEARAPRT